METSNFLEKGNIPNEEKDSKCNGMKLYPLIVLSHIALVAVSVSVACVLCFRGQSPEICWAHATDPSDNGQNFIKWQWNLTDCSSFVRNDSDQKLEVLQSGMYFVYGQVYRQNQTNGYFTLVLYKDNCTLLNQVTGPNDNEPFASINFGRPYFLRKGEKLFCSVNNGIKHIQRGIHNYWGLYKM